MVVDIADIIVVYQYNMEYISKYPIPRYFKCQISQSIPGVSFDLPRLSGKLGSV